MSAPLAMLLAEWDHDGKSYRLIGVARQTRGYTDRFVLESRDVDALGGPCWVTADRWDAPRDPGTRDILAAGMRVLAQRLAVTAIPAPPLPPAVTMLIEREHSNPMHRIGYGRGDDPLDREGPGGRH